MNAKHTPGPWIWSAGLSIWRESDSQIVSSVACDSVFNPTEEEVSNARLIAAAPDLLAALEIAEGRLMCIDAQKLDTVARNDDVIDRIRAAIAKAKGE
jgi:hypothetical protein